MMMTRWCNTVRRAMGGAMMPAGEGSSVDGRIRKTSRLATKEKHSAIWMFRVREGSITGMAPSLMVVVTDQDVLCDWTLIPGTVTIKAMYRIVKMSKRE